MTQKGLAPVEVGVVGLGRFGRLHALTLAAAAGSFLAGIASGRGKPEATFRVSDGSSECPLAWPSPRRSDRLCGQGEVDALTEGVVQAMLVTKIKSVLAVALVLGMALGGIGLGVGLTMNSVAAAQRLGTGSDDATESDKEKPKPPDNKQATDLQFEQVVWVRNKAPQISALYVLLPEASKDLDEIAKLVLRYAPAALREVDELAGPDGRRRARLTDKLGVGFVVRQEKEGKHALVTGFSIDQLREYTSVPEEKALKMIRRHAWTFQKLPLINPGP
jgi:hypothetical protein